MTCRDYQHQISLFLYEELNDTERPRLEAHLQQCEPCRLAYEEEKGLHFVLAEDPAGWDLPSDLLVESRRELANQLDTLEKKRSWFRMPTFSVVFTPMRLLESAALIAMGLALGVYVSNQQRPLQEAANAPDSAVVSTIPANGSVSNLRIVSANPSTGEVELAGEVVQPLRFQGKTTDDTVLQLLFSAASDSTNPGARLRAVEVLAQGAQDRAVKDALIHALMYDNNAGVRLRAARGLEPFIAEREVRAAFMHSLENDVDAGIRVAAIEALTRNSSDTSLAKALEAFAHDDNNYVRMKALQFVGTNK